MADGLDVFQPLQPELLVASFQPAGRLAHAERAWTAVFGDGEAPWARLSEEDRQAAVELLADAARGRLSTHQVFSVDVPDRDEPLPVLLSFLPVYTAEPTRRVTAVAVTGEVLAEPATWTTSQTHRHRMETLGRMTMGIAHDFNNLLSGVIGHAELMRNALAAGETSPAELGDNLRTIEQAAMDGAALVRKIQQYIRQEKHERFEHVDLATLVNDCVALTRPYWYNEPRRQGIAITADLDLDPIPQVLGSPTELREVLVNLILNAVHAMPRGGTILFTARTDADGRVVLRVRDSGTGMSESVRKRIFEPLFTTKGEAGTGMGLAVSYGIIQAHEGAISVESAPGRGTAFTLTFPPAPDARADAPAAAEERPSLKVRILFADDEPMVRTVFKKLLSLHGHTVIEADSGRAALEKLAVETVDIVFTDHGMPGMSGRELAAAICGTYPGLPVVMLTGDTEPGEQDACVAAVVSKPFRLEQIESLIQRLLSEGRPELS